MVFNYGPTNPGSFGYRPGYPIIQGYPMPNTAGTRGPDMRFTYTIPGMPGVYQYGNTSVYGNQLPGLPGTYGPSSSYGFGYPGPNGPNVYGWQGGPGAPGMAPGMGQGGFYAGPNGMAYGPGGAYYGPGAYRNGQGPIAPIPGMSPIPPYSYPNSYGYNFGYGNRPGPNPNGFGMGNMPNPNVYGYGPPGMPGYGPGGGQFGGPDVPGAPGPQGPYVYGQIDRAYPFGLPPEDDGPERRRPPNPAKQEWGSPFGDDAPWMPDRGGQTGPGERQRYGPPANNYAANGGGNNLSFGIGNGQGGGNQGKSPPQTFPVHPCARSPRDFFMFGEDR
jgi:hypothetical protein